MAVIDNTFETQGTHLYFVDTVTSSVDAIAKVTCPTGITGIADAARDSIDTTCLDVLDGFRTRVAGMADPAVLNVPFILYDGDAGHQTLIELRRTKDVVGWLVGLSDATTAPTVIDSDGDITAPAGRTCFTFKGYVANVAFEASTNEVIRGTLTVQPSGAITPHWAA